MDPLGVVRIYRTNVFRISNKTSESTKHRLTDSLFLQDHQGPRVLLVPQVLDLKVKKVVEEQQVHWDDLVVLVSLVYQAQRSVNFKCPESIVSHHSSTEFLCSKK